MKYCRLLTLAALSAIAQVSIDLNYYYDVCLLMSNYEP